MKPAFLTLLALSLTFAHPAHAAPQGDIDECPALRKVPAKIEIQRMHYVQKDGNFEFRSDVVCRADVLAPVQAPTTKTCINQNLLSCPIVLDGHNYKISASGSIRVDDSPTTATKHFTAWYHVDRNSGDVRTGEAASSEVALLAPYPPRVGLSLQSKMDGLGGPQTPRDGISITITYEDQDAR